MLNNHNSPPTSRTQTLIAMTFRLIAITTASLLVSCGSGTVGSFDEGHGPFDSDGNYVEAWADRAPKNRTRRAKSTSYDDEDEDYVAKKPSKKRNSKKTKPTVAKVKKAPSRVKSTKGKAAPKPQTKRKAVAKKQSKPKRAIIKPKARPPIMHKVRRGDTLYAISKKYNTSISRIQKANGLSGSNIRLGQTLAIPR